MMYSFSDWSGLIFFTILLEGSMIFLYLWRHAGAKEWEKGDWILWIIDTILINCFLITEWILFVLEKIR